MDPAARDAIALRAGSKGQGRPMRAVTIADLDCVATRRARRRDRAERAAGRRAAWWFPFVLVGLLFCGLWGLLRLDQYVADRFFWPTSGAQFVEVGPEPDDPETTGGRLTVVAGGLNRKSGTGPALALLPALSAGDARVFSLVYGNGINDDDIRDKFRALVDRVQPDRVDFFGSSMGGDVVLRLAQDLAVRRAEYRDGLATGEPSVAASTPSPAVVAAAPAAARDRAIPRFAVLLSTPPAGAATSEPVPPALGLVYLDCTPLGADDVRDVGRTQADAITALSEALHTDGGVGVRLTAEVLAQQPQWSTGRLPFVEVRWGELGYKIDQVWRDKIAGPGISTQLVKDQYGVIRRFDIRAVASEFGAGARIVYFRPEAATDDRVVRVDAAEAALGDLARQFGLDVQIAPIAGGHHASAESNPEAYLAVLDSIRDSRVS